MRLSEFLDFQIPGRQYAMIALTCTLTVASLGTLIFVRTQQAIVGYKIAEQEEMIQDLENHYRHLRLEQSVLRRPERIQKFAHDQLNMRNSHD